MLDRSSKKFICPMCEKKSFVRYVDQSKNYHDDANFGRCDRENNCGYLNVPTDGRKLITDLNFVPKEYKAPPTSYIPFNYVNETWKEYKNNPFTLWLVSLFGDTKTVELIKKYRWGVDNTSVYTKEYTIFWQIDIENKVRSGKMIKYHKNGRRDKDSFTTWYHKKTNGGEACFKDFYLTQCLFGEHLLPLDARKPVAVVESEKTAIIASMFIDKYIWVACGGSGQLSKEKMNVLKNRSVTLFPDLGQFDSWKEKAKEYGFNISDSIEKIATDEEKKQGLDLADFLLK